MDCSLEIPMCEEEFAPSNGRTTVASPAWALSASTQYLLNTENSQSVTAALEKCNVLRMHDSDGSSLSAGALRATVELCGRHAVRFLSIAPAAVVGPNAMHYQDALNHTLNIVRAVVGDLECAGVTLCLQAATHGFLLSAPELRELIDLVNSASVGVDFPADPQARDDHAAADDWLDTLGARVHLLGLTVSPARYEALRAAPDQAGSVAEEMLAQIGLTPPAVSAVVLRPPSR